MHGHCPTFFCLKISWAASPKVYAYASDSHFYSTACIKKFIMLIKVLIIQNNIKLLVSFSLWIEIAVFYDLGLLQDFFNWKALKLL